MPELPEVQTIVTALSRELPGRTIRHVELARGDVVRSGGRHVAALVGRKIASLSREGKRILIGLGPAGRLVVHLGMTGRLTLESPSAPLLPHTHLRMRFDGRAIELRFRDPRRFGGIWIETANGLAATERLSPLGPDALSIRVPQLRTILGRRRQLKALLLDQRIISGLGNIYADEALHAAGLHPLARADRVGEAATRRLACAIRTTLRRAIAAGGSTLNDYRQPDGSEGFFQLSHRVYGREGEKCRTCGTYIRRIAAAGRSTHYCSKCQRRR